jgi:hypothetical protein
MSPEKKKQISDFLNSLNREEQIWSNGYLDGILQESTSAASAPGKSVAENKKITIAYGTNRQFEKLQTFFASAQNRKASMPNW